MCQDAMSHYQITANLNSHTYQTHFLESSRTSSKLALHTIAEVFRIFKPDTRGGRGVGAIALFTLAEAITNGNIATISL